jgi:hypothetical protein
MKRLLVSCGVALSFVAATVVQTSAEVKTREKTAVKFEGGLGRVIGLFGGKAAREGMVSTTAVKGNRKVTMSDNTAQIVDLDEEKIYDIDFRKKEYRVTTFDELRRRLKEAQDRAARDAEKEEGRPQDAGKPEKELEIDFDLKETGQTRPIAGYDAREVVMTITIREKGRTLDDGGGLVMTANSWLGPQIREMKELGEFEMRYWQKLQGGEAAGVSAEQMAAVLALYPMVAKAMERLRQENVNLNGTPLATTTTFEAVKSREQVAQEAQSRDTGGGGGISGRLAARLMKKSDPKPRATIMTMQHEVQEVATTVPAGDLALPAGFKQK